MQGSSARFVTLQECPATSGPWTCGAVTETVEATGSIEMASNLAPYSTVKMTKKYSRGDGLEASRKIAEARAESRK